MQFGTKAVHAGVTPDPSTGAIMTPVYQTSTYVQESPGVHKGFEYGRTQNPTRSALEASIAALENGVHGLCFASGLAATDAVLRLLQPGDEVVATSDLYGGTYRLFMQVFARYGLRFRFADLSNPRELIKAVGRKTRMVWVESPTNPMMSIVDLRSAAAAAKAVKALLVVDNTFASPCLQNPLDLGADLVVHSATKYLGGHSDVVMGAVAMRDDELRQRLAFLQNACGAVPGPNDCFLVLRGIKTLHLRMERHCHNAGILAAYLEQHRNIARVYWPGLPHHPNHATAARQMKGFGGMISFVLKEDSRQAAFRVLERFRLFALAESLGGVESLCGHPASMTHASIPREEREKTGLRDSLIRLSVGIEDEQDLLADLEWALA